MEITLENTIEMADALGKQDQIFLFKHLNSKIYEEEPLIDILEREKINVKNGKYKAMELDEAMEHLDSL